MIGSDERALRQAIVRRAAAAGLPARFGPAPATSAPVDTVVACGVDDEPLVSTRATVLAAHAPAVVRGLAAAAIAAGAGRLVVTVRRGDEAAARAAAQAAAGTRVEVVLVGDEVPAADADEVAFAVAGRIAAPMELAPAPMDAAPAPTSLAPAPMDLAPAPTDLAPAPMDLAPALKDTAPALKDTAPEVKDTAPGVAGVLVLDVQDLVGLDAANRGQPLPLRAVTVAGAVRRPGVVRVPRGAPLADLVAMAGGATAAAWVALRGGPVRGPVADPDDVVDDRTFAVTVLPADHPVIAARRRPLDDDVRRARSACAGCRSCTDHCPRFLLGQPLQPHELLRAVGLRRPDEAALAAALHCSRCGLCEVVCPAGLHPGRVTARVQDGLRARGVTAAMAPALRPHAPAPAPHPQRLARRLTRAQLVVRLGLAGFAGAAVPPPPPPPRLSRRRRAR